MAKEQQECLSQPDEVVRDGGAAEAASFVAEAVADLALVARRHRLDHLGYLLDMARLEAEEFVRVHGYVTRDRR